MERTFWKELFSEIGGESRLEQITHHFKATRLIVDKVGVQKLEGISEELYKVVFIIFPDNKKILFHIHNQEFEDTYGFPEEIFLPLPEKYFSEVKDKVATIQSETTRFKFNSMISGPFIDFATLTEFLSQNPILENLVNVTIQGEEIPAVSAEVFYYPSSAMSGYLKFSGESLILKKLNARPSVYMLAHELIHHFCYVRHLYQKNNFEAFQQIFSQQYPQLYQAILENYRNGEILDEELATLFGAFADMSEENEKVLIFRGKQIPFWVKTEDVEFFADLGLIPEWMRPSHIGYFKDNIDATYYQLVRSSAPKR